MASEFRKIGADNIDALSSLFERYSGQPLHKQGILRSAETLPAFGVWEDGEPAGFYYTLAFAPDLLKLTHIFVPREARRRGHGSAMLAQLFGVMPDRFAGVIAANSALYETAQEKADAEPFYLRNGFAVIARTGNSRVFWKARPGRQAG